MSPRCLTFFLVAAASVVSAQPGPPFASGVWCGNVTPTSASVVVRLTSAGQKARLQVSSNPTLTAATFSTSATTAASAGNTLTLTVQGLVPDTDYYYGVEVAGVLRTEAGSRGRFHTFPLGRGPFRIAFAGDCDFRDANLSAFDAMLAEHPLLFIDLGDLHYSDINSTDIDRYRDNYDLVLNEPHTSAFFRSVALAYVWDDHDYCGNDTDGTAAGRDTVRASYKERAPHYPITVAGGTIAQAFTIGRVRVIMTDTRSASDPAGQKESAAKTRLGTAQKTWFKQELISARDAGFPLIIWVNPDPWIDAAQVGADSWGAYATERTELANFIRDNRIANLVMLSADMHGLAYDDGTHSDYATGGGAPIIVLQGSALSSAGNIKGGPYTGGPLPGSQQYGILEVYDNGGPSVACRFLGMKVGEGAKLSYIFSADNTASPAAQAFVNISTLAHLTPDNDSILSGFVISGPVPRNVLVRAVGPALTQFGVTDVLARPQLVVYQSGRALATNDAWAPTADTASRLNVAFNRAGAFCFSDASSCDAALLLTLAPGAYTIQVKSASGASGTALLEVYDVPQ